MLANRQTLAWGVLGSSFALFCLILLGLILTLRWYWNSASDPQEAHLTVIGGTVLVRGDRASGWVGADREMVLSEGQTIKTDETSQALLTLFDQSTLLLFPDSEVTLKRHDSLHFQPQRMRITMLYSRGKARVGVAKALVGERRFEIQLPQAQVLLSEGSYNLSVNAGGAQVRVRDSGRALVSATGKSVELRELERTEVSWGGPPSEPLPSEQELVYNGDFSQGLEGWRSGNRIGFPEGQDITGKVETVSDGGRNAVRFYRRGSKGTPATTWIYQEINQDISDFSALRLSVEFRLLFQSVSGGGYLGSEYPVMLRLNYKTPEGDNFNVYGFYYQNEARNRTDNGVQAPYQAWTQYTVPENLMTLNPPPRQILSLEVSASGHDYESLVSRVSLVGQ